MGWFDAIAGVWEGQNLGQRTFEHLYLFGISLAAATIIGVIIGILIYRYRRTADATLNGLNVIETIPDLALLFLLIPLVGIGEAPTILASVLYSILPIARNTYTGLANVGREYIEVAKAMGMTEREVLFKVRLPMALPLMVGGIRIALVFCMGLVTLGGLIAAGGLGAPIQTGMGLYDMDIILVTGLWVGFLAIAFDGVAALIERKLRRRYLP
jgi:osmoprotectant transport system permease protein